MGLLVVGMCSLKKQEVGKFQIGKYYGGKFSLKLEKTERSWQVSSAIFSYLIEGFPSLIVTSQLRLELFNFILSNVIANFQI